MVAVLSEVGQCVKTRMEKKPNNYLFLTLGFGWGGGAWVYDHAKAGCWTGDGRTSKLIACGCTVCILREYACCCLIGLQDPIPLYIMRSYFREY